MIKKILNSLWFFTVVSFSVFFFIIATTRLSIARGLSMMPTFEERTLLVEFNLFETHNVGDIVAIRGGVINGGIAAVKRVVGVPGESVTLVGTTLTINGRVTNLETIHPAIRGFSPREFIIEEDNYFVLGDNTAISRDSRQVGTIHIRDILSRVVAYTDLP